MKKINIFIIIFFPIILFSQQNMEGTVRYLVSHNWAKKLMATEYLSKQQREKSMYMWGNRSEWKEYMVMHFNLNESKYEESEEKAERAGETYNWRKETFFIKRNFQKMTTYEGYEILGKTYIVEDSLYGYDWKIQNDLKEVAGHVCMKAFIEDTVKKQKIVAWFAQDIPLSMGPERFHGLPGLIMELDYNDGAMVISADKIDYKKLTVEMDTPKKLKGKKIKENDYQVMIQKHVAEKTKSEEPWFWGIRY
jgi:GLPGLI family protein